MKTPFFLKNSDWARERREAKRTRGKEGGKQKGKKFVENICMASGWLRVARGSCGAKAPLLAARLVGNGPGQFLGSYMIHRLVQWLIPGGIRHQKKKESKLLSRSRFPSLPPTYTTSEQHSCVQLQGPLRECRCAGTSWNTLRMEHPIAAHHSYAFSTSREG